MTEIDISISNIPSFTYSICGLLTFRKINIIIFLLYFCSFTIRQPEATDWGDGNGGPAPDAVKVKSVGLVGY